MEHKRLTLFAGHYGSGKTNIAVNYAMLLADEGKKVCIADLDIVNPYFRTKDSEGELAERGITLICSHKTVDSLIIPQSLGVNGTCVSIDGFCLEVNGQMIVVGEQAFPRSFCTIKAGRIPDCSEPT